MHTDTIQIDTATHILQQVKYMGETIPLSAQTEMWVFICLGTLLFLLVVAVLFSSSSLVHMIKTLFELTDRNSIFNDTTINNSPARFLLTFFFISVFSLFSYLYLHLESESFPLIGYLIFLGVTTVFFIVKLLLFNMLGFVFLNPSVFKTAKETYFNILSLLGLALYPLLVIRIYAIPFFDHKIIDYIILSLLLLTSLFIVYKLIRIFFNKLVDLFYILLYLCTLEILPFIALFQIYEMMV
jgi:hypothetical protein